MSSFLRGAWVLTIGILVGVHLTLFLKDSIFTQENIDKPSFFLGTILGTFLAGALREDVLSMFLEFYRATVRKRKPTTAYDGSNKNSSVAETEPSNLTTTIEKSQPLQSDAPPMANIPKARARERPGERRTASHQNEKSRGFRKYSTEESIREVKPVSKEPSQTQISTFTAPSSAQGDASRLVDVWEAYLKKGDGHFNAGGLQDQLETEGVAGRAVSGQDLGADDSILGVDVNDGLIYLLPNFSKSPRAVKKWFDDRTGGALTTRINRVDKLAVVRKAASGIEIEEKGIVG